VGQGPIIIDGAPPFGVQLKRQDFERLLTPGQGSQGWVNDVIMDFMGNLVNKVHSQRYVFHSYLRECFLLGPEKGRRALVRVVKKMWGRRNDEPEERVRVAQELLRWVLRVLFANRVSIDEFEYEVEYIYQLPTQVDGYNCGIYVGLYMLMISRNIINYTWPTDMDTFRWRLALAIEYNDPEVFLDTQLPK
jgi:hypothetical protein